MSEYTVNEGMNEHLAGAGTVRLRAGEVSAWGLRESFLEGPEPGCPDGALRWGVGAGAARIRHQNCFEHLFCWNLGTPGSFPHRATRLCRAATCVIDAWLRCRWGRAARRCGAVAVTALWSPSAALTPEGLGRVGGPLSGPLHADLCMCLDANGSGSARWTLEIGHSPSLLLCPHPGVPSHLRTGMERL